MALLTPLLLAVTLSTSAQISSNISLKNEVEHAIERGADWLVKNQAKNGSWSSTEHPAVTALALIALKGKPTTDPDEAPVLRKGYDFLLKNIHEDGTIHGGKGL